MNTSLQPYSGPWTDKEASHLLRRTVFGHNFESLTSVINAGMNTTVDFILRSIDPPEPPLNYNTTEDPDVAIGETWVDKGYNIINFTNNYRHVSIRAWLIGLYLGDSPSIREKLTLFWHNHFVVSDIPDARFLYRYYNTLQTTGLHNFRDLVKQITIDPAMLQYLNGDENTVEAPNENYARELLELFTVGKGALAGSGDYTTFTEEDVQAIAKVLTGWITFGRQNSLIDSFGSTFRPLRHDTSTKKLSARFNNVQISNNGNEEYSDLIDAIFEYGDPASFIVRKLYRWFVYYEITEEIENNIIQPLAQIMRESDFDIMPVLDTLFRSQHFYDAERIGCMIKSPIDFMMAIFNQLDIKSPEALENKYTFWAQVFSYCGVLQQEIFSPPNVAGWKAYYQEPSYYQLWINSVTIPLRRTLTDVISYVGFDIMNERFEVSGLKLISELSDPYDINVILSDLNKLLMPKTLTDQQLTVLKAYVLQGLPDFEWTVEYSEHLANPDDQELALSIENKLKLVLVTMLRMPEYYLS